MESKIHLRVGLVEVDFEGSEDYIKNSLPDLVDRLLSYIPVNDQIPNETEELLPEPSDPAKKKIEMTTNSIAAKFNVKSATELILAACAHLQFVKGADTFTRANILAEMKTATNYHKPSYVNNLSKYLSTLVKTNKLIERSSETYAFSAEGKKEVESRLL